MIRFAILTSLILSVFSNLYAKDITVHNSSELLSVLQKPQDVASIHLLPGKYSGGIYIHNISGQAKEFVRYHGSMIPKYWEEPELVGGLEG